MSKLKYVSFGIVFSVVLCFPSLVNAQITVEKILNKSIEACRALQSIEYEIHHKNAKGKYGWPEIKATIIQQKEDVENVSFGKAYMRTIGTIKHKGKEQTFEFSYDGSEFLYKKGKNSKIKKVADPKIIKVAQLLQQHFTMLHFRPLTNDPPFAVMDGGKVNSKMFTYEGEDYINGELCYKLQTKMSLTMKNPKSPSEAKTRYSYRIWWISANSYLPMAFTDNFVYKEINIKSINTKRDKSFYTVNGQGGTELYTYDRIRKELYSEYLLPVNSKSPEWTFETNNKTFSSNNLKGKIVLFDFWGTWCPGCLQAMPEIEKINKEFSQENDVLVVGISAKERDKNAPINYFKKQGYTYLHIPNGDSIAEAFKVGVYPTIYIVDKDGVIRYSMGGFDKNRDHKKIKELIESLL